MEATGRLIGGFVINEGAVFVFENVRLARHQSMDAVVVEAVVLGGVARDFDTRVGTERHGNKFIHDGDLRVALIAADDGVGHREP